MLCNAKSLAMQFCAWAQSEQLYSSSDTCVRLTTKYRQLSFPIKLDDGALTFRPILTVRLPSPWFSIFCVVSECGFQLPAPRIQGCSLSTHLYPRKLFFAGDPPGQVGAFPADAR